MAQAELTRREMEVLELLVSGHTNQGVADLLSISEYSVKKHVGAIIQKLFARNRTHAAALAVHKGLIPASVFDQPPLAATPKPVRPSEATRRWEQLTRREFEILMLLGEAHAMELTNEGLAQELKITRNTLRKHLRNIYKKLDAKTRAGLVRLSLDARRNQEYGRMPPEES